MAFPNHENQFQKKEGQGSSRSWHKTPKPIEAKPVPNDYVEQAEKAMRELIKQSGKPVTTTKIRNLFSLVVDICSEEELRAENTLQDKSVARLKRMYVRVVYESGRDDATKRFVETVELLEYLKDIGNDREKLIRFTRYMEALVAFHRYLGGKEA